MHKLILIVTGSVALAAAGYFLLASRVATPEEGASLQPEQVPASESVQKLEGMYYAGEVIAGRSAPLLDFKKSDYDLALKTDKLIVLYFYATWCPICKYEVFSALYPFFDGLDSDKVIGFRINYNDNDTDKDEIDLAREFGVAYQHTKVFLKDGRRVLKSPESWNKDRYLMEINKFLSS